MRINKRRGTTLVEVLIALGLLSFILLVFLSTMGSSAQLSATSRESAIAAFDMQTALEQVFSTDFERLRVQFGTPGPGPAPYALTVPGTGPGGVSALNNEVITVNPVEFDPNYDTADSITFEVVVTYTDHRGRATRDSILTRRSR